MQIDIYYKNVDHQRDKDFILDYLEQKKERFEKLIDNQDYEVARLEAKAEIFATKSACRVDLILHLPKNKYMSSEDDHSWREAVDLAVDKMITQLRKEREKNNS